MTGCFVNLPIKVKTPQLILLLRLLGEAAVKDRCIFQDILEYKVFHSRLEKSS